MNIPGVMGDVEPLNSGFFICVVQESCPYMEKMDMCMMHVGDPADTEAVGCRPAKADTCPPNAQKRKLWRTRITSQTAGRSFGDFWLFVKPGNKFSLTAKLKFSTRNPGIRIIHVFGQQFLNLGNN